MRGCLNIKQAKFLNICNMLFKAYNLSLFQNVFETGSWVKENWPFQKLLLFFQDEPKQNLFVNV